MTLLRLFHVDFYLSIRINGSPCMGETASFVLTRGHYLLNYILKIVDTHVKSLSNSRCLRLDASHKVITSSNDYLN